VYLTTTNKQGNTITYVPTLITTTMVFTNSLGDPVTVTRIVSNPSLLPGDHGAGASAFFRNKGAVAGVFATVGLLVVAILSLLIWHLRSRHKHKKLVHDNDVAAIMEGRRSTGRLTLIDDDDDDGGHGHTSSIERSPSGHRRTPSHGSHSRSDSYTSSDGRMDPNDSAGKMTSRTGFPPVSLLAASYNLRRGSSHGAGGGSGARYQHLRTGSAGAGQLDPGRESPSPPPRFSDDYYRDPFSDSPLVTILPGAKGDNKPPPGIMDEFESVPLTLGTPISPSKAHHDLFGPKREFNYDNPFSSSASLNTGASTPKDLEVRNVFDEEFGTVPKIRRKPMLAVLNHP